MFILDSHCDTPSEIFRSRDISIENENAHVDLPKLKRGEIDGAFFAMYIPASMDSEPDKAFEYAKTLLDCTERTVRENSDSMAFASDEIQALANKEQEIFSVFTGLENASPIGDCLDRLNWFYDRGVRYVTLCHSSDNQVCDSCASEVKRWGGLSPFGKKVVERMNSLGMLVDVSHVSDDTFYDVLKYSTRPVVATHSCCRALCNHPRNMTDDMIRALAAAGGVIQINFYPYFIDPDFAATEKRPSYTMIADHIDHAVSLVGVGHVGIGSDFDGIEVTPDGMDDISMMPVLFDELRRRGYSENDLEKIAGGNFFRVLRG